VCGGIALRYHWRLNTLLFSNFCITSVRHEMGAFSVSTRGNSFNHFFLLLQCVCATVFLSVTEAGYPCTDCNDPANCWIVPDDSGNVNIDSSVTSIPDNAWKNCGLLQSISFSNAGTLRSMGEYTFAYSHLKGAVVLPDSLESIGIHSFDTVNIESINIPPLLTIINDDMFTSNMMLTTVTFESHGSLAEIGTNAFYSCVALNDVVLPDNGLLTYVLCSIHSLLCLFVTSLSLSLDLLLSACILWHYMTSNHHSHPSINHQ
jgi:hypothetical protein